MTADFFGAQRPTSPHGDGGPYRLKPGSLSSHGRMLSVLQRLPRTVRILDVGTSTGYLGDVVICADVLEHLVESTQVLWRLSQLVAVDGWIIILFAYQFVFVARQSVA